MTDRRDLDDLTADEGPEFHQALDDARHRSALMRELVAHRAASGLTMKELAARAELMGKTIRRIDEGHEDMRLPYLMAYARAIGLRVRITLEPSDSSAAVFLAAASAPTPHRVVEHEALAPLGCPHCGTVTAALNPVRGTSCPCACHQVRALIEAPAK